MALANQRLDGRFDIDLFVEAVKSHPFLFDKSHKRYKDILLKASSWATIALQFGLKKEEAKVKWKGLRDRYLRERKAYVARKSVEGNNCAPPRWKVYGILSEALDNCVELKDTGLSQTEKNSVSQYIHATSSISDNSSNDACPKAKSPVNETLLCNNGIKEEDYCEDVTPDFTKETLNNTENSTSITISLNAKKRKLEETDKTESIEDAKQLRSSIHHTSTNYTHDEVFHYFTSLMARFRNLSRKQQISARFQIESLMYKLETETETL